MQYLLKTEAYLLIILFNEFFLSFESDSQWGSSKTRKGGRLNNYLQAKLKREHKTKKLFEQDPKLEEEIEWNADIERSLPLNDSKPKTQEVEHKAERLDDDESDEQIKWRQQIDRSLPLNESYDPGVEEHEDSDVKDDAPQETPTESLESLAHSIPEKSALPDESSCKKYFNEGKYEKCVSCFSEIIGPKSYIAKHYRSRGLARTRLKEPDLLGAIYDFEKSLEIEPKNVRGQYLLGRTNFVLGKYDTAISNLNLARQFAAEQELITDERNQVFSMLEKACTKTVEVHSSNLRAWTLLGLSSRELGKYDEAIKTLEKALQIAENMTNEIRTLLEETKEKKEIDAARKEAEEEEYLKEMAIMIEDRRENDSKGERETEERESEEREETKIIKLQPQDTTSSEEDVEKDQKPNAVAQLEEQNDEMMLKLERDTRKEADEEYNDEVTRENVAIHQPKEQESGVVSLKLQPDVHKEEREKEEDENIKYEIQTHTGRQDTGQMTTIIVIQRE